MALKQGKYWYQIFNKTYLFRSVVFIVTIILNLRCSLLSLVRRKQFFGFIVACMLGSSFVGFTYGSAQTFAEVDLQEINDLIVKAQQYRSSYSNYRVRFREINENGVLIGDLAFAKPNRLRINYYRGKTPITEVYLGTEKLIVYFITSDIVYEQENFNNNSGASHKVPGSLDYLLEKYNFNFKSSKEPVMVFTNDDYRNFNLTKNPNQIAYHLELTPKNITEGLDNLEIWIAAEPNKDADGNNLSGYTPTQILRSKTTSVSGNISDIYFAPIEVNQQFPVDLFTFVVPVNVRIVKNFFPALDL